ncbi:MAG: TIR domain-containing protein [Lyngbya sp. HA4199-MV5]|jgi:WD40 repeat protein/tetratricopeptide (TPR) repeat protein|nr:TIR domain-containing protein [Lyngbya sp. HA4199-MV5]
MADVFISYSRKDKDFVKTLHTALAKCDRDAWVDWEDIPLTADWWQEIERGIEAADTFVFVVSADSVASRVCNQEIDHAVKHHKRFVPVVRRDDFDRPQAHEALRRHNWLFFRDDDDFDQAFQSLLDAIDLDLEHVHAHTRLLVRAIEWNEKKQDDSFLLRGSDLKAASGWLSLGTDKDPKPTALQTQYILASGKAEIQRQRQTSLISIVGFVGAIGLALLALTQYQQAEQRRLDAEKGQMVALSASSRAYLSSNQDIEALIDALKLGQQLKRVPKVDATTRSQAVTALQQVVYTAKERNRLEGHTDWIRRVSYSSDGQTIATGSDDKTVKLWKPDGTLLKTLKGNHSSVLAVSLSPNGQIVASSDWNDNAVTLRNRDGKLLRKLKGHEEDIDDIQFSPDGRTLAAASSDGIVKLWTVDGTLLKTLKGHDDSVKCVQFSPNGQTIATASNDRTVKLWTVGGTLLRTFTGHRDWVNGVSFSPDGQTIATASDDRTVKLWNLNGTIIKTLRGHTSDVRAVSFSPDGQKIATAGEDKSIKLWKPDGTLLATLKGHSDRVFDVRFSPKGDRLISSSGDGTAKLWQLTNTLLPTLKGHDLGINSISFSPDGQMVVTVGADKTAKLWQLNGNLLKTLTGHLDGINDVSVSPDSQTIATASADKTIKLWQRDGTLLKTLPGHQELVSTVSFRPDSQTLLSLSDDRTAKLWKLDGTLLHTFKGPRDWAGWSPRFSPDGEMLATLKASLVKLWKLDGTLLTTLKGHKADVHTVSFSPDGQTIASGSWDRTAKLWRRDGTLLATLKGHSAAVSSISFSPDSQRVVTTSNDNTVKLWQQDGTLLLTLPGQSDSLWGAKFSPDGNRIAFTGRDKLVTMWDLAAFNSLETLLQQGCHSLRDYLIAHPTVLVDLEVCQTSENLVAAGTTFAKAENVPAAVAFFRKALQQNSGLSLNPDSEAQRLATQGKAQRLVEEGQDLAQDEKLQAAIAKFREAQSLDPTLSFSPETEAQRLKAKSKAQRLVEEGWDLARQEGNVAAAITSYRQAMQLDHDLAINPEEEARYLKAYGLAEQASGLISQGQITTAVIRLTQAETLKTTLVLDTYWNYLCGGGSVRGRAAEVMPFCEKAIASYPRNGEFRDSRGFARAMTGDFVGAIEDFQAFIDWTDEDDRRAQRQRWINQLQQGNNPFTPQELQKLKEKELL